MLLASALVFPSGAAGDYGTQLGHMSFTDLMATRSSMKRLQPWSAGSLVCQRAGDLGKEFLGMIGVSTQSYCGSLQLKPWFNAPKR